jgi:HlyD family secretion protein
MRRGRWLLIAAIVLSAVAGYAYWRSRGRDGRPVYQTEVVDRGPLVTVVTATGTLNPVTSVQVGTYISGPIIALDVDFNSQVRTGQRVAQIDPRPFEVKVRKAEANLANARAKVEKDKADLHLKELTLKRNQDLMRRNFISQSEVDTARSDFEQARAQMMLDAAAVLQVQADLEDARINLGYTDIRSPVDGVVVSRNVDVGQTVAASFQTPTLFLIAQDLTKMQVDTAVSESDIGQVQAGQEASFTVDAYGSKTFNGKVMQVRNAPTAVQNVVTYDVVVAVDNQDLELKPGMTATVTLTTAKRDDVLRVPVRALRFNPSRASSSGATPAPAIRNSRTKPSVWVLEAGGTLRQAELEIGLRNEQIAEVISGPVAAGDKVAVAMQRTEKRASGAPALPGGGPRYR